MLYQILCCFPQFSCGAKVSHAVLQKRKGRIPGKHQICGPDNSECHCSNHQERTVVSLSSIASTRLTAWSSSKEKKKKNKSVAAASFLTLQLLVASLQQMQTTAVTLCSGLQQSLLLCHRYACLHRPEWFSLYYDCSSCINGEGKKREGKAPKSMLLF